MSEIFKRKIYLYGNPKIMRDFEILFEKLNIEKINYSDDKYIFNQNKESGTFVICEKEKDELFESEAEKNGWIYGKNYFYIEDFFAYYNPMFLERGERKLAVWGTGACSEKLWNVLSKRGDTSEIDFYIDNAAEKKTFKNKAVVSPMEIADRKDIYIIVASDLYQWEIYNQIESYGYRRSDYTHYSSVIKDYRDLLRKVCFSEKRYSYKCERPSGYCDVIGSDLYLCCPDFLPVSAGSMQQEAFMSCWDSYVAKILRLSICNGTYAFCNKQYCDLFDFEKKDEIPKGEALDYKNKPFMYPSTLMVGIDSTCNLKCPSCRPDIFVASGAVKEEIDRESNDLLENVIPHVNRLWLAGSGEVFFSPTYRAMLCDERCQKRSSISILSNGTLFDKRNWELLEKSYQSIEVVISMDGIKEETIERLRKGADAAKLKENLEFLGRMRKSDKIDKLFLSCVLQAANVGELYELLEYCRKIGVDKVQFLKLKNNGVYYTDNEEFDKMSIFDKDDCLKEKYKSYFTDELLFHPLADWFNNTKALNLNKRKRLDSFDTF